MHVASGIFDAIYRPSSGPIHRQEGSGGKLPTTGKGFLVRISYSTKQTDVFGPVNIALAANLKALVIASISAGAPLTPPYLVYQRVVIDAP